MVHRNKGITRIADNIRQLFSGYSPCRAELLFLKQLRQPANLFQPQHFILVHSQFYANTLICPAQTRQVLTMSDIEAI